MAGNRKRIRKDVLLKYVTDHATDLKAMAADSGVSYSTLRRARDGGELNPHILKQLAEYMKIPVEKLVDESDNPDVDKAEWRQPFAAYLKEARRIFSPVDFLGTEAMHDDRPIRLEDLYVIPQMANTETRPEYFDKDRTPARDKERGLAELTPEFMKSLGQRTVFLAGAGYGKTTLVRWLILQMASARSNEWRETFDDMIPLPMILREMRLDKEHMTWEQLLDQTKFARFDVPSLCAPADLEAALKAGKVWIMLDGLDEIPPHVRTHLHAAIWDGMRKPELAGCRWLFTSRIQGYDEAPVDKTPAELSWIRSWRIRKEKDSEEKEKSHRFQILNTAGMLGFGDQNTDKFEVNTSYVAPFDETKIVEFAGKWYVQREATTKLAQDKAKDFEECIFSADDTKRLARIPSLLAMMAVVHRNLAVLPKQRADLYERIAKSYIETIDNHRKLQTRYTYADSKQWLGYASYAMQFLRGNEKGRGDVVVTAEQLRGWFAEAMQQSGVRNPHDEAELFLKHILERSGLIGETAPGKYAFLHLTFQEYFAAQEIIRRINEALLDRKDLPIDEIRKLLESRQWAEVFMFVFQTLDYRSHQRLRETLFQNAWESQEAFQKMDKNVKRLMLELAHDDHAGFDRGQPLPIRENFWAKVKRLALDFTDITDLAPLARLTMLQTLGLSSTQVTDAGLEHLATLTALQILGLNRTQVTDAGLEQLVQLTALYALSLNSTRITDAGLEHLATLTALQILDLDSTQVTDIGLEHLATLTALELLSLSGTQVTDAGLEHLATLTALQSLELSSTQVTDAGLEHLAQLTALQTLNLLSTQVSKAGVAKLKSKLPGLEVRM
ncbi:MAG: NACHT domain-containing protein [Fimbriiglobus sp.]